MIHNLLTALVLLAPQAPDSEVPIAQALEKLELALKSKDTAFAIDALLEHGKRSDPRIPKLVALGWKSKNPEILAATIQALRFNPDPSAVTELLKVQRKKPVVEHLSLGPAYFTALGQQRSPKVWKALAKSLRLTKGPKAKITEARILALGRIREVRSIEALLKLQRSGGGGRRGGGGSGPQRNQIQMALMALTGENPGKTSLDWSQWWSDNKRGYQFSREEVFPKGKQKKSWTRLWSPPKQKGERDGKKSEAKAERKKRRKNDRKKDPAKEAERKT